MSATSSTVRETVRDTVRDAKDAARESVKAASDAGGKIQADLEALRDDVARLQPRLRGARGVGNGERKCDEEGGEGSHGGMMHARRADGSAQ